MERRLIYTEQSENSGPNFEKPSFCRFCAIAIRHENQKKEFQHKIYPLLACYLFVQREPSEGRWQKTNNTLGIVRIVRLDVEPGVMTFAIIADFVVRRDEMNNIMV